MLAPVFVGTLVAEIIEPRRTKIRRRTSRTGRTAGAFRSALGAFARVAGLGSTSFVAERLLHDPGDESMRDLDGWNADATTLQAGVKLPEIRGADASYRHCCKGR
jgi:hypothetical protein